MALKLWILTVYGYCQIVKIFHPLSLFKVKKVDFFILQYVVCFFGFRTGQVGESQHSGKATMQLTWVPWWLQDQVMLVIVHIMYLRVLFTNILPLRSSFVCVEKKYVSCFQTLLTWTTGESYKVHEHFYLIFDALGSQMYAPAVIIESQLYQICPCTDIQGVPFCTNKITWVPFLYSTYTQIECTHIFKTCIKSYSLIATQQFQIMIKLTQVFRIKSSQPGCFPLQSFNTITCEN